MKELKKLLEDVSMKIDNVVSEIMNIENLIGDSNHVLVQGRVKGIVEGISRTTRESLKLLKQTLEDDLVEEMADENEKRVIQAMSDALSAKENEYKHLQTAYDSLIEFILSFGYDIVNGKVTMNDDME